MVDLWPEDIDYTETKAPVSILKEQASLLGNKTKNLLKAEVRLCGSVRNNFLDKIKPVLRTEQSFCYTFYFVAPTLNNYRYRLFTILHGVQLYPLGIDIDDSDVEAEILKTFEGALSPKDTVIAHSESEFLETLQKILNADKTKQIMKSILAQTSFEPA